MEAQFALLKEFVNVCKKDPSILHHKDLAFYREHIESFGGSIPPLSEKKTAPPPTEEKMETEEKVVEEEEEEAIPAPELDESGVIGGEKEDPPPMGDSHKEPSDDDMQKASNEREAAQSALSHGNLDGALTHFTNAIQSNPTAAALYAKRAQILIKLNRPLAAIRDCDKAIELNADSAIAYKFRGRAHRLLGHWVKAHTDLAMACKLDYDESANEWLKEVEGNAKKVKEYERLLERKKEEKELNERRERMRKAQEANAKARTETDEKMEEGEEHGMGGLGAMFGQMFSDPEMKEAVKDPKVMEAVMEIMQNPSALMKYMGDEKIMKVFTKMQGMFGGADGGHCEDTACQDEACGRKKEETECPMGQSSKTHSTSKSDHIPDLD